MAAKVAMAIAAAAGAVWCVSYLDGLNQRIDAAADTREAGHTGAEVRSDQCAGLLHGANAPCSDNVPERRSKPTLLGAARACQASCTHVFHPGAASLW